MNTAKGAVFAAALFSLVTLVSCSGGSNFEPNDVASSPGTPLDRALGVTLGDLTQLQVTTNARASDLTYQCMRERGFEYERPSTILVRGDYPDGLVANTAEWRTVYGFGISTEHFPDWAVATMTGYPTANAPDLVSSIGGDDSLEDRSKQEDAAYRQALYGDRGFNQALDASELEDAIATGGGCLDIGFGAALAENPAHLLVQEFGPELDELRALIDTDPRITSYDDSMASCLRGEGFAWTSYSDFVGRTTAELVELRQLSIPEVAMVAPPEIAEIEDLRDYLRSVPHLSDRDAAALRTTQQEEIAVALAFERCEIQVGSWDDLRRTVRADAEQWFVSANDNRLKELFG